MDRALLGDHLLAKVSHLPPERQDVLGHELLALAAEVGLHELDQLVTDTPLLQLQLDVLNGRQLQSAANLQCTPNHDQTTAKKKSIYDQILISAGSYSEFTVSPILDEHVGIVVFDNDPAFEWFIANWHNAIKMLTDHRPIWIRLRIDQPDDD
ncbi:MAG TPA: hypothetical protein VM487_20730 [Phycisphaerae bacterium]|nr:hypothetical protein [Phycisphaerae bacterium]